MRFRFTGEYTGGRNSVSIRGVTFNGYDPTEVADEAVVEQLKRHPEVETVTGRPPKVSEDA